MAGLSAMSWKASVGGKEARIPACREQGELRTCGLRGEHVALRPRARQAHLVCAHLVCARARHLVSALACWREDQRRDNHCMLMCLTFTKTVDVVFLSQNHYAGSRGMLGSRDDLLVESQFHPMLPVCGGDVDR